MSLFVLYGNPGWGSAIVEAQLEWHGLPFEFRLAGDVFSDAEAREALGRLNPLAQMPTLVLEDGAVMTESAAITLWLADLTGSDDLVPKPDAPERAAFLRWLVFIVANIYPTYTYADDPARFVDVESAREGFAAKVHAYACRLYAILDAAAASRDSFLPGRFSALDIYIAVMTRWRPRAAWFSANTPKLWAIAERTHDNEKLKRVWARNFPEG
jgi:GST-like protein